MIGRKTVCPPMAKRVRESMARLTPQFSASRAIQNYTEEHYLPAASNFCQRAANNSALGAEVMKWLNKIARGWSTVHFGGMQIETRDGRHSFQVQVWRVIFPRMISE